MGLDISYYSKVEEFKGDDGKYYDNIYNPEYNGSCIYHLGSLNKDKKYIYSKNCISGGFCAGSYSGYNYWRNQLSNMAGYGSDTDVWNDPDSEKMFKIRYLKLNKINGEEIKFKPFYELINFSDAEGFIGPEICKKLYEDFVKFDELAKQYDTKTYNNYFYKKYCEWKEAFKVASEGGIVHFH